MSKKSAVIFSLTLISILAASFAWAAKPEKVVKNVIPAKGHAVVTIPAKAAEVAPGIFWLGESIDNGRVVEGYAIVRYKDDYKQGNAKPGTQCGNNICEPGENANKCPADCGGDPAPTVSSCYSFLAKDAKWKTNEPYIVNATNTQGLIDSFVKSSLAESIVAWESAAGADILGSEVAGVVDGADMVATDGKNEVMFGEISNPGAIAVTIVWGIFGGPPFARELVEWDQVYDQVDFDWSATGEIDKMDFGNIAIHELGHSFGLADLYTAECSEQTMYGYATEGETKKQTLEAGDITGIQKLY